MLIFLTGICRYVIVHHFVSATITNCTSFFNIVSGQLFGCNYSKKKCWIIQVVFEQLLLTAIIRRRIVESNESFSNICFLRTVCKPFNIKSGIFRFLTAEVHANARIHITLLWILIYFCFMQFPYLYVGSVSESVFLRHGNHMKFSAKVS